MTFAKNSKDFPREVKKEILWQLSELEQNYPNDKTACVLLLDCEQELKKAYKQHPFLQQIPAEVDQIIDDYRNLIYIINSDGSAISIFWRLP